MTKRRKKYRTIVVDPPWHYQDKLRMGGGRWRGSRGADAHYKTLSFDEIVKLPVSEWARTDAHLYVWVTNAFMIAAHQLVRAWGFQQRTILTWGKDKIGMGHYYRNNTEHLLFAVRGKLPPLRRDVPTLFRAPRLAHSEKPDKAYRLIEMVSPGPRLDVFARKRREGWDVYGDEVEGSIEL